MTGMPCKYRNAMDILTAKIIINNMAMKSLLIVFITLLLTAKVSAANNILNDIEVHHGESQSTIYVTFTEQLVYRSHAPKAHGDLININVNRQGVNTNKFEAEFLAWKPSELIPLFEVSLESINATQGIIVFRFDKQIEFHVQSSSDSYSITVMIFHPKTNPVVED